MRYRPHSKCWYPLKQSQSLTPPPPPPLALLPHDTPFYRCYQHIELHKRPSDSLRASSGCVSASVSLKTMTSRMRHLLSIPAALPTDAPPLIADAEASNRSLRMESAEYDMEGNRKKSKRHKRGGRRLALRGIAVDVVWKCTANISNDAC